ncbi:hypothetical protein OB236_31620 [Paenibacillus sp. WQ 127069]|uniref:DUF1440 domain-containing protein n=1 Tax=Paenibacillus baimaensis TaxID=2982185 RepID=A0ABT2UPU8_9BACL|nr:hypothetical protein [Paenibacillus sp. WQ 127069]MCU6796685.1 hypothetical protein [Paenibacillus sp. WQ 127069]
MQRAIWAGIGAGLFIGIFFRIVEFEWKIRVYTLLLNVDYVPVLRDLTLTEATEFSIHMIISAVAALVFYKLIRLKDYAKRIVQTFVLWSVIVGAVLYLTTMLSSKTPAIYDVSAITVWLVGHAMYGFLLALLMGRRAPR